MITDEDRRRIVALNDEIRDLSKRMLLAQLDSAAARLRGHQQPSEPEKPLRKDDPRVEAAALRAALEQLLERLKDVSFTGTQTAVRRVDEAKYEASVALRYGGYLDPA